MVLLRHSTLRHTLALLLLLIVGADLGVHGLFASDFAPAATGPASVQLTQDNRGVTASAAPDHCFCHSLSMGAVVSTSFATLTHVGDLVLGTLPPLPCIDPVPLDKPPQLGA